MKVVRS